MIHLIVNPNARRGKNVKLLEKVETRLRSEGVDFCVHRTKKAGDATKIAREITAEGEDTVVAMGGDGTLNEVVCGISDPARTTLGLIPAGTGNDFATAAKIPFGLAALDLILRGEPKPTDYLECGGGMRSINIAGMGIDVAILRRCERMRGSAKSKYFRSLLATLCTFRGVHMKIVADGVQTECKALIAAACNGSRFGGGIAICPPAALDDGKLDLVVIECPKRYKIPYYLVKLKGGKVLSLPPARHILCDAVEIVSAEECGTQFDGELRDSDKLSARVVRGGLRMYRG